MCARQSVKALPICEPFKAFFVILSALRVFFVAIWNVTCEQRDLMCEGAVEMVNSPWFYGNQHLKHSPFLFSISCLSVTLSPFIISHYLINSSFTSTHQLCPCNRLHLSASLRLFFLIQHIFFCLHLSLSFSPHIFAPASQKLL